MKAAAPSELEQLAGVAAAADRETLLDSQGTAAPGEGAPGPAPAADPAKEWAQFPALFGSVVGQAMPELLKVYSDEACLRWGAAMVPLADRYGWKPAEFMAWLGPWAGVALATWPLAVPTVQAIRARRAQSAPTPATETAQAATATIIPMPGAANDDPDLRDPTQANKPPRPV